MPVTLLDGPLLKMAHRDVPALSAADTVFDAARLMAAQHRSFVPVLDAGGRALGVVTEARLLAAAYGAQGPSQLLSAVMQPALCLPQDVDAASAFQQCLAEGGAPIARRTVAKYREAVGLGSSVQRRRQRAISARAA